MKRIPEIGERVKYEINEEYLGHRVCTGTVTKVYEGLGEDGYIPFDQDPERWSASVEVDYPLPSWWAYNGNKFAPSITSLSSLEEE